MAPANRRDFLKFCLGSTSAMAFSGRAEASRRQNSWRTPASIEKYLDPLPIPKRLAPLGRRGDTTLYRIRMMEFSK
jgi:spore coat protein A